MEREQEEAALRLVGALLADCRWAHRNWQLDRITAELLSSIFDTPAGGDDLLQRGWRAIDLVRSIEGMLGAAIEQTAADRAEMKIKPYYQPKTPPPLGWTKQDAIHLLFEGGYTAAGWSSISRASVAEIAEAYLGSGLASSVLEWMLVDMLVYCEVRDFGEAIKSGVTTIGWRALVSPQADIYHRAGGDLVRMQVRRLPRTMLRLALSLAFWVGIPIFIGVRAWEAGYRIEVWAGAWAWALLWALFPAILRRLGYDEELRSSGKSQGAILHQMGRAYRAVQIMAPPAHVRRCLDDARREGAVWDAPAYALLANAERRNSVVWATLTDGSALRDKIERRLKAHALDAAEAG